MNIERKKARLAATINAALEEKSGPAVPEPVAIIGLSANVAQSSTARQFWQALDDDRSLIEEIPATRFDYTSWYGGSEIEEGKMRTRWGGFIPGIDQFDPGFFGMLPADARRMDPQQRLLLMSVRQTFEDAGYRHTDWKGTATGVFIAAERNEYHLNLLQAGVDPGDGLDQAASMLANRVSHFYDLRGPSERIDAMCAGGAMALHHAVTALRSGEINAALVGACNLLLRPDVFVALSQSGQMSPEPTVRSFGAGADGYLRGEGVCSLLLKPLSKAEADGDHIYGLIRNTAINYNGGDAASIAAPSVSSHSRLVQDCYRRAGIDPRHVSYIEAQGMGNPVADIAEWDALNYGLLALGREQGVQLQEGQCAISTLKPMSGHMHAASAIGALFKIIRSLQTDKIHKILDFEQPNPHLHTAGQPCRLATETFDWPRQANPRLAGLHSYGAGGNNAHILVEEYVQHAPGNVQSNHAPLLFPLSAPSPALLAQLAAHMHQVLSEATTLSLESVSDTLKFGREKCAAAMVIVATGRQGLLDALGQLHAGNPAGAVIYAKDVSAQDGAALEPWAHRWLAGERQVAEIARAPRVPLPATPFDTRSFWYDASAPAAANQTSGIPHRSRRSWSPDAAERAVRQALAEALERPAASLDLDAQFSELGFDSMMVRQLCRYLREQDVVVEPAVLFEHATPARLVSWLASMRAPGIASPRPLPGAGAAIARGEIAIIGMAGVYPKSADLSAFWDSLANAEDCIETVPEQRWNLDEHFDSDRSRAVEGGKSYGKWGGFIDGLDEFDPMFFNFSLAEATYMHPKERQFIQCVWHALEDAGYPPERLEPDKVGVFVGVSKAGHDNYKDSFFSVANRVSYRFGFSGPSLPVDTACSSSLTAVHEACLHLQAGECTVAVAGGVNAYTHPSTFAEFARLGVLSADGKSRAFGAGANGFVPGEGVGALLLKPLERALADGDMIHGIIAASAVNHGGKANGYTVPNPEAQRAMIRLTLDRAGLSADQVTYVEAHGTGTALGDPIEFRGLVEAFRQDTERTGFCRLGSVKTNIGHLEAAAGIAGLSKILLQMRHGQIAPSLHSQQLNPDIDASLSPFRVPQTLEPWNVDDEGARERIACLSSFGAGGANAHLIVRQAPVRTEPVQESRADYLILLSARHEAALERQVDALLAFLERHPSLPLRDIAYTLQVGRQAMNARLSCIAASTPDLVDTLRRYRAGEAAPEVQATMLKDANRLALFGQDESALALLDQWYADGKWTQLAQLWRAGEVIDWGRLVAPASARRISLPGYSFDREPIPRAPQLGPVGTVVRPAAQPGIAPFAPAAGALTLLVRPLWQPVHALPAPVTHPRCHVILCEWPGEILDRQGWQLLAPQGPPTERYVRCVGQIADELRRIIVDAAHEVTSVQVVIPVNQSVWLSGIHGLLRSAQLESSKLRTQLVEIDESFTSTQLRHTLEQAAALMVHPWLRFDAQGCHARQWAQATVLEDNHRCAWKNAGVYLLTGGLGGLAQCFAADILSRVDGATVVLVGRSPLAQVGEDRLQALRRLGGQARYEQVDICDGRATERLVADVQARHGPLTGVLHCAGTLHDGFLRNFKPEHRDAVLAAKVAGTWSIDQATRHCNLDCFVLFSSAAAAVGHPGQAFYAAANGFLDGFAEQRTQQVRTGERHGRTVSIAWGLWRDGGMQLDAQASALLERESGMIPLSREHGLAAFHQLMGGDACRVVVIEGDEQRLRRRLHPQLDKASPTSDSDMRDLMKRLAAQVLGIAVSELEGDQDFDSYGLDQARFNQLIQALDRECALELSPLVYRQVRCLDDLLAHVQAQPLTGTVVPAPSTTATAQALLEHALQLLKRVLSPVVQWPVDRLDSDEPLERYGLDSMMVMTITAALEAQVGALPKTLFFEYSTLRELAGYLCREHAPRLAALGAIEAGVIPSGPDEPRGADVVSHDVVSGEAARSPSPADESPERLDIAIIGLAGRYPQARTLDEFWQVLSQGRDCISEIPAERWDHSRYYSADEDAPGKTYARWGGFIDGVTEFDPAFFGISPREAAAMEPQERLFLQTAHEAIEDAGYTRQGLAASARQDDVEGMVGVFVGVTYEEYQLYGAQQTAEGRPLVLSMSPSSIANRVSFVNGFHGPSMAIDAMCASSLTTIHLACQSLRSGECQVALAGGVNVSIHPAKFLMLGAGKFASRRGRCESFGAGGSGYVPSEGVGAVLLKPLHQAQADGDRIYGVIRGSAINHGGRTNGYAVPNPAAQAAVIGRALRQAHVLPRQIGYVEAHGTGTVLGDPIEVAGLTRAWRAYTPDRQFCALGSVKSNIGHCESAAGIAGLTKVLLQMKHGLLVSSLHADTLNPNIDFSDTPFSVQRTLAPWERPVDARGIQGVRTAAISSFGAGGANAHLIVSEAPVAQAARTSVTVGAPLPVVLSARSREALQEVAQRLVDWLGSAANREPDLPALAYTLQVGREAWEWRVALLVTSTDELLRGLRAFIDGALEGASWWSGSLPEALSLATRPSEQANTAVRQMFVQADLEGVLRRWVKGEAVDWSPLYRSGRPARLGLPTYPFARQRYWAPSDAVGVEEAALPAAPVAAGGKIRLRALNALHADNAPALQPAPVVAEPMPVAPVVAEPLPVAAVVDDECAQYLRRSLAAMLYCEPRQIRDGSRFLELGLDSVIAAQWIRDINKHYRLKIPADSVYTYPVFKAFAQWVNSHLQPIEVLDAPHPSQNQAGPVTPLAQPESQANAQRDSIEAYLRQSLGELLFLEPAQVRSGAQFLDLGMDSVTGTQWMRGVSRHFSIQLASDSIYKWPTLKALTDEVTRRLQVVHSSDELLDAILTQVQSGALAADSACAVVEDALAHR
ncbi:MULTISPECIES: SDR family NAD(P)-dependent oxidoreductase [Pseudomonas fluorescens group]|uniref:SDR family NAD(P)-dependent oxidoreductase n=1 Tax=Pseudomonas fluorescens TaxID=294 RepID=A0AAE2U019_PSEFL|nr:SDR family NAD(P)-dependent oxidoreductase [Pseudomonas orientalis]MBA1429407.1 SDR family NAD(P)-dependent oxidoreductase [Pseudomonas orientalis]MBD8268131.1 SDR family NAD(P)-dependent oxidoreductase [Pseudomonas fluorescens]